MLTRVLIYIKHHLPSLWQLIEYLNIVIFKILHDGKLKKTLKVVLKEFGSDRYTFRKLKSNDLSALHELIGNQSYQRLKYFNPHGFDNKSLRKMYNNPTFLMLGAFEESRLVGYFFLRCFWNKKCFKGRLIDEPYENNGIGNIMNNILIQTAWRSGFRCFSTISKNNDRLMQSYASNKTMKIIMELENDYLLLEFIQNTDPYLKDRS